MTKDEMREEHNAFLRKLWATGHCDTAFQTEAALLLDARLREIENLQHDLSRSMANHVADINADEPEAERDKRLGRVLYERMEHMDPSHEERSWEQLSDRERDLYVTCAESVVVALNQQAEPRVDAGLRFKPVLERASNTREGWTAEMEQVHDGEWVHISALDRE